MNEEAIREAAGKLYERAVAMHESIHAGDGAIGWQDALVLKTLRALVQATARRCAEIAWPECQCSTLAPGLHHTDCIVRKACAAAIRKEFNL